MKVAIVGAGFSGLTLAWKLTALGIPVEIFEARPGGGGLIQSHKEAVLVESAAHALLASAEVEALFRDLDLDLEQTRTLAKTKWFFRSQTRRYPLSVFETLRVIPAFLSWLLKKRPPPSSGTSLASWVQHNFSSALNQFVLSPAVQGIYGVPSHQLSARLVLGGFFVPPLKVKKGLYRGSVAPRQGMQSLVQALTQKLIARGVVFHWQESPQLADLQSRFAATVLATSIEAVAKWVPAFSQVPRVSLSTMTVGYSQKSLRPRGFGCLFPEPESFESLGVLFNTDIFPDRGELQSETWIFGADLSEEEMLQKLRQDRRRLLEEELNIEFAKGIRWPLVLPLYGVQLEALLDSDLFFREPSHLQISCLHVFHQGARLRQNGPPLYLTGNYLGGIGLTKILEYNGRLSLRIQRELL